MTAGRRPAFFSKRNAYKREFAFFKTISTSVFYDRSLDIHTPSSLKLDTISTGFPATKIWFSSDPLYLRKLIIICLHFLWFSFIPRAEAKAEISFTTNGIKLGEYVGIISKAEVSSANLILPGQSLNKELMRTANNNGPNFVPWGRPPFVFFYDDLELPTLTHCSRFDRNALIHRIMAGCTPRQASSLTITL